MLSEGGTDEMADGEPVPEKEDKKETKEEEEERFRDLGIKQDGEEEDECLEYAIDTANFFKIIILCIICIWLWVYTANHREKEMALLKQLSLQGQTGIKIKTTTKYAGKSATKLKKIADDNKKLALAYAKGTPYEKILKG